MTKHDLALRMVARAGQLSMMTLDELRRLAMPAGAPTSQKAILAVYGDRNREQMVVHLLWEQFRKEAEAP